MTEVEAHGIPAADAAENSETKRMEGADPYVVFRLASEYGGSADNKAETTPVKNAANPSFDDRLELAVPAGLPRPLSLDVGIWDKDYHKDDDLLATQRIDLSTATSGLMRHHRIKCPALAEGAEIKMLAFKWEIVDAEPADDDED